MTNFSKTVQPAAKRDQEQRPARTLDEQQTRAAQPARPGQLLSQADLLAQQRALGNRAVQRVLAARSSAPRSSLVQRAALDADGIVKALTGISFVRKKLDQKLALRRNPNQDNQSQSMREQVGAVLEQYEGHLKGGSDAATSQGIMIAMVLEAVARVIAVNELNDPALTPQLALKLLELYGSEIRSKLKKMDQAAEALQLASALVADDPVGLYMHRELRKDEAARRIRILAASAGKTPAVMFLLLRQRFESQMASLTQTKVQQREDTSGSYNVKETTGEVSLRYFQELFGTVAQASWGSDAQNRTSLQYTQQARQRLDDLETEVTTVHPATDTSVQEKAGLTFKQSKHLHEIEQKEATVDRASLDNRVDAALAAMFKIGVPEAGELRETIKAELAGLPITITVRAMNWFGKGLPDSTVYKAGSARRKEKTYAKLFDKKQAQGSIKHLGEWEQGPHEKQDRGKNYNRFRSWKDQRMTGNLDFSDAEMPVFGAVNVSWDAYSSQSKESENYAVNAYGDTHFLMNKAHITDRLVYTATDHGQPRRDIWLAFCDLLLGGAEASLTGLKDVALSKTVKHIVNAILLKQPVATSTQPFEVQIFGQVDIARDVDTIFVAPSVPDAVKQNIQDFAQQSGVQVQFIAQPADQVKAEGWFEPMPNDQGENLRQQVQKRVAELVEATAV